MTRAVHNRKAADFLRNDVLGNPEKKCLECTRWLPLTREYYQQRRNRSGSMAWQARCKICESPRKKAMYEKHMAELRGAAAVPLGKEPPRLTWKTLFGWMR